MMRIAVLGSTRGTSFPSLYQQLQKRNTQATIELVVSHRHNAGILEKAKLLGIQTEFVDPSEMSHRAFEIKLSRVLQHHHIDCVILLGYMRILSPDFVMTWRNRILNVHPSLLPAFAGLVSDAVHREVLSSGVKETGCTVHLVTNEVDAGPILIQKKCPVLPNDTVESLKARVQSLEGEALVEGIEKLEEVMT
ncbi:MAG: phosphoribosylglycinamide formyltransferase [Gammaproteobacteria bacterium]|nr:phosphoribosylglycinamide formyltransferase [Gammaproteobacteria bacterium]